MTLNLRSCLPRAKPPVAFNPYASPAVCNADAIAGKLQAISNTRHPQQLKDCKQAAEGLQRCTTQRDGIKLVARLAALQVPADRYTRSLQTQDRLESSLVAEVKQSIHSARQQLLTPSGHLAADAALLSGRLAELSIHKDAVGSIGLQDLTAASRWLHRSAACGDTYRLAARAQTLITTLQRWRLAPCALPSMQLKLIDDAASTTLRSVMTVLRDQRPTDYLNVQRQWMEMNRSRRDADLGVYDLPTIAEERDEGEQSEVFGRAMSGVEAAAVSRAAASAEKRRTRVADHDVPSVPTAGLPGAATGLVSIAGQVRDLVLKWWNKLAGH